MMGQIATNSPFMLIFPSCLQVVDAELIKDKTDVRSHINKTRCFLKSVDRKPQVGLNFKDDDT